METESPGETGRRFVSAPRGFTLIELLATLTVVTILAILGGTYFSRILKSAKSAKDQSQLRQLGLAHAGYMADNNLVVAPGVDPATSQLWFNEFLRPYLGVPIGENITVPLFVSPSDPLKGGASTLKPIHQRSYAVNRNMLDSNLRPVSIVRLDASKVFYLINFDISSLNTNWCDQTPEKLNLVPDAWHINHMVNLLFLDGHVEAILKKDIYPGGSRGDIFGPQL